MRLSRLGIAACGAVLCSLILSASAFGKVYIVDSTGDQADQNPGNGMCATAVATCTLRAAIQESNVFVPAPPEPEFINFDPALTGVIGIGSPLSITAPVSIDGNGSGVATTDTVVDGDDTFRLLSISSAGTPTITIRDMRFRDGGLDDPLNAGGAGILTSEDTTLANVVVTNNQITGDGDGFGAGVAHTAAGTTLALTEGSAVTQNTINLDTNAGRGAGIDSAGTLSLSAATVNSNSALSPTAPQGGGIAAAGPFSINNSTVAFNSTGPAGSGGGLASSGLGTRSIVNSTLSTNSAGSGGGGGAALAGTVTVTNSTFALNMATAAGGGGLDIRANALLAMVTVKNTIIGSSSVPGACFAVVGATIQAEAQGFNIDAGTSCGFGTANGNQENANPLLAPLTANGGSTLTHALDEGSPALDAADPANLCGAGISTDQRFVARPQGPRCDIGALEVQARLLSAGVRGSGRGTIFSSPAGITCPNDCAERLLPGSVVTLTALSDSASTFTSWEGCDSVSGNQCTAALGTFAAGADRGVSATFTAIPKPAPDTSVPKPGQGKKKKCKKGKKRKGKKCVKKKGSKKK